MDDNAVFCQTTQDLARRGLTYAKKLFYLLTRHLALDFDEANGALDIAQVKRSQCALAAALFAQRVTRAWLASGGTAPQPERRRPLARNLEGPPVPRNPDLAVSSPFDKAFLYERLGSAIVKAPLENEIWGLLTS